MLIISKNKLCCKTKKIRLIKIILTINKKKIFYNKKKKIRFVRILMIKKNYNKLIVILQLKIIKSMIKNKKIIISSSSNNNNRVIEEINNIQRKINSKVIKLKIQKKINKTLNIELMKTIKILIKKKIKVLVKIVTMINNKYNLLFKENKNK